MKTQIPLLVGLTLAMAPQGLGQWVQTSGPEGAIASALLHTGQSILLCASTVYRSTDDGESWVRSDAGLGPETWGVHGLALKGSTVFAGTGIDGVYRSSDDGLTWERSSDGMDTEVGIEHFAFGDSLVFASSEWRGVFRSSDNGTSWTQVNGGLTDTVVSDLLRRGTDLYAATWDHGLFRSTDDGDSWNPVNGGLSGNALQVLSLAATSTSLLAGTRAGVYRSTDGGGSWVAATSGLNAGSVSLLFPSGPDVFGGTFERGVYRSTDDGVNWETVNSGLGSLNIRAMTEGGNLLLVGTYGGSVVSRSTDRGLQWTAAGRGIVSTNNYAIAALGGRVLCAASEGIRATTDNGQTWVRSDSGFVNKPAYCLWVRGSDVYLGSTSQGVYRSADSGASWMPANGGLTGAGKTVWSLTDDGIALYAGTTGGVYRSTDNGGSWQPAKNGLTDSLTVSILAVSGTLFAGTPYGLYRSTNQGTDWTSLSPALPAHYVNGLASVDSVVLAAMQSGIYRSTDNGESWMPASVGISPEARYPTALLVYGNYLFAGMSLCRAYVSGNAGLSWTDISAGLLKPGIGIRSMVAANGYLWAATTASGVWKRQLSEVTVAVPGRGGDGMPAAVVLQQNYPNPFNPSTTIRYGLSSRSHVTLTVYNTLGQQVTTLVEGEQEAGYHETVFDASGLASGVYLYRLQAGDFVHTRKLVLVR